MFTRLLYFLNMYSSIPLKNTSKADISSRLLSYAKKNLSIVAALSNRNRIGQQPYSKGATKICWRGKKTIAKFVVLQKWYVLIRNDRVLLLRISNCGFFPGGRGICTFLFWSFMCSLLVSKWSGVIFIARILPPPSISVMKRRAFYLTSLPFIPRKHLSPLRYVWTYSRLIARTWRLWVISSQLSMSTRRLRTASYIFVRSCFLPTARITKHGIWASQRFWGYHASSKVIHL